MSVVYINVYEARKKIQFEWDKLHQTASLPNVEYLDASKVMEAVQSPPDIIKRFTSKRDLMLHIQSKHYFEKLTSVKATNGKDPDKIKAILPERKESIIQLCLSQNPIAENIYSSNGYYILRIKIGDYKITNIKYTFKPGFFGRIMSELGRQPVVQTYPILWDAHSFQDSGYRYVPIFINPKHVASIYTE